MERFKTKRELHEYVKIRYPGYEEAEWKLLSTVLWNGGHGIRSPMQLANPTYESLKEAGVSSLLLDVLVAGADDQDSSNPTSLHKPGGSKQHKTDATYFPEPSIPSLPDYWQLSNVPRLVEAAVGDVRFYRLELAGGEPSLTSRLPDFFIDTSGVTLCVIDKWLGICSRWRPRPGQPGPAPLFISGMTKTGKSHVLTNVLPARVAAHSVYGAGMPREVLICRLNFMEIVGSGSYTSAVRKLLLELKAWHASHGMPWNPPTDYDLSMVEDVESAVMHLLRSTTPRPVLYLIDEFQQWYRTDQAAAARELMKTILLEGPSNALFAVTGSDMCTVWHNVADTSPHGTPLLLHNMRLDLPASIDARAFDVAWKVITDSYPDVPSYLKRYAVRHPAMMMFLCEEALKNAHHLGKDPSEEAVYKFVVAMESTQIYPEVVSDLYKTLESMSVEQRQLVHLLSTPEGTNLVDIPLVGISTGFDEFIGPYLERAADGGQRIASAHHRRLVQELVDKAGTLHVRRHFHETSWVPLSYAAAYEAWTQFGKECGNYKGRKRNNAKYRPLRDHLETVAQHPAMQRSDWFNQPWVTVVVDNQYNQDMPGAGEAFTLAAASGEETWQLLRRYHELLGYIGSHENGRRDMIYALQLCPFTRLADGVLYEDKLVQVLGELRQPVDDHQNDGYAGTDIGSNNMAAGLESKPCAGAISSPASEGMWDVYFKMQYRKDQVLKRRASWRRQLHAVQPARPVHAAMRHQVSTVHRLRMCF